MWPFQQAASFLASLANARRGNRSLWILCIAGSGFLGAATFFSEPFGVPNENLDPSWNWALHEAFSRGLRFGHDIVFTYGPFGFLAGRMYHPQTFLLFVALKLGLSLLIIWSLFEITRTRGQWFLVVPPFFLLCSLIAFLDDSMWAFMQFCLCIALTRSHSSIFGIAAGIGFALISLIKFTFLVSSVLLVVVLALTVKSKTIRWCVSSFACGVPSLWMAGGQSIVDFPNFFLRALEVSSGYSEAMSFVNDRPTLISLSVYLSGFIVLLGVALLGGLQKSADKGVRHSLPVLFGIILIGLLSFKHGFVRNDCGHLMISFSTLSLLALIIALTALIEMHGRAASLAMFVGLIAMMCFAYGGYLCKKIGYKPARQLAYITDVAMRRTPPPWHDLHLRFEENKLAIKARNPLPTLEGYVDTISYNQGVVFAHNLQWKPRPVIQSYSCYTPKLITLNAEALEREGPDNLLVKVQPIDERLATQEDSLVWRQIFDWYTVAGNPSGFAHLKRRSAPLRWTTLRTLTGHGKTGEMIQLPETQPGTVLWVIIDLSTSLADRFWSTILKPPPTYIITDGLRGTSRNRYMVAAGQAGFIISPRIRSTDDLEALLQGELPSSGDVSCFSLERGGGAETCPFSYQISIFQRPL